MGKARKQKLASEFAEKRKAKMKAHNATVNPFEMRVNKRHFDVLGQKVDLFSLLQLSNRLSFLGSHSVVPE